jgi:hypothetical protein
VPDWLAERMARLGRVLSEAIVLHYGRDELLRRLSHPFWFQSLGALMGMDWHSSGITPSVLGALKRGLAPVSHELGVYVCGGKGKQSRLTPAELLRVGERTGLDGEALARTSRLTAKVDSALVQDGYQVYVHGMLVTQEGRWAVVQQGMNPALVQARRYHWLSEGLSSFVDAPHAALEGVPGGDIVNLTDRRAAPSRAAQLALLGEGPGRVVSALALARAPGAAVAAAATAAEVPAPAPLLPHLQLPAHHEVRAGDVVLRRLHGALAAAAERGPEDFPELLLTPGVGARTVLALAQAAEVVHGAPYRFSDPARRAFAHGGKDRHPFPVPLAVYDATLGVLRHAVDQARLGNAERLDALKRLDAQARALEASAEGPSFKALVAAGGGEGPGDWEEQEVEDVEEVAPPHVPRRRTASRKGLGQLALPGLDLPPGGR